MDLEDSGVECIYDGVWEWMCVSPVMSCVQACSQGQTEWVMNIQWQDQRWLSEIQALGSDQRLDRERSGGWGGWGGGQMDLEAWKGLIQSAGCIFISAEENEPIGKWQGYMLDQEGEG